LLPEVDRPSPGERGANGSLLARATRSEPRRTQMVRLGLTAIAGAIVTCMAAPSGAYPASEQHRAQRPAHARALSPHQTRVAQEDRSGRKQRGHASYYSHRFAGRRMANGARFNPDSNIAASKHLPLGTTARVTNLHNGRSAEVIVQDRGPHAKGRIMDVS